MTSDEIKNYEIAGTEKNDPRLSRLDSATDVERNMMLKEIAYQLSVMNERNAELDKAMLDSEEKVVAETLNNFLGKQEQSYAVTGPAAFQHECISNDGDKCKICGQRIDNRMVAQSGMITDHPYEAGLFNGLPVCQICGSEKRVHTTYKVKQ